MSLDILSRLSRPAPRRTVVDLCEAVLFATDRPDVPEGVREFSYFTECGDEVVFRLDPRNALGITDDGKLDKARGVLFAVLGCASDLDGKDYTILLPDETPVMRVLGPTPQADGDPRESPESDLEYARRRPPTYYEARPDKLPENVVPTLNLGASK